MFSVKLCFSLIFLTIGSFSPAFASTPAPTQSAAEAYVLKQVATGALADLKSQFPDEQHRTIRAVFVEDLIMNPHGKMAIHRNGILIAGAVIADFLNLPNLEIPYFVSLSNCTFHGVNFVGSVFKKGLQLDGSEFEGKAWFTRVIVENVLYAQGVHFNSESEDIRFDLFKTIGPAMFPGAIFKGSVNFSYATIDGAFQLDDAQFINKAGVAMFNSMNVDRGIFMHNTVFEGGVNFINAKIDDSLDASNAHFNNNDKTVYFQMMSIGRNLFLKDVNFNGPADFSSANVNGVVQLDGAKFHQITTRPIFQNMKAGELWLNGTVFDTTPTLIGLTYSRIYPHERVLEYIKNSPDFSAYSELESYLAKSGNQSEADDVFIAQQRYERPHLNWYGKARSYLSDGLQGFGRKPYRLLWVDIILIVLGVGMFRQHKMVQKKPVVEQTQSSGQANVPPYNAFLYSLTLFAPAIDSQYTNNWDVQPGRRGLRFYQKFQTAAGYIFVPLSVAIWTGILK